MARPSVNQKKQKQAAGLPTFGPQVPSWYGNQRQVEFPAVPAYTRPAGMPGAFDRLQANLARIGPNLQRFQNNLANFGQRQQTTQNRINQNLGVPLPPQTAQPPMQAASPLPQSAIGPVANAFGSMVNGMRNMLPAIPNVALPQGMASMMEPDRLASTQVDLGTDAMYRGMGLPGTMGAIGSQEADLRTNLARHLGNLDVQNALRTGSPGYVAVPNQQDMLGLIQSQAGRQASVEGLRTQLGPGPSGIPLTARDAAAQGNMAQGTPWQPVPGTVGLPPFIPQAELDRQIYEGRRTDEAQRYQDFVNNEVDPTKPYYTGLGRGRPQPTFASQKNVPGTGANAVSTHAAATKDKRAAQRASKMLNQRAAVFARAHGLPMNTALLMLTAMDEQGRAAGEGREPSFTREQRMANPPMAAAQTGLDQMEVARQNALSNAMAGGAGNGVPMTPALIEAYSGAFPGPTGLPKTPTTDQGLLTPTERQAQITAQASGDEWTATHITERRSAIEELRGTIPDDALESLATLGPMEARNLLISYLGDNEATHAIWQRITGNKVATRDDFARARANEGMFMAGP